MSPNVILFWLIHSSTSVYRFASQWTCTSVGRSRGVYRRRPKTMVFIRLSRGATATSRSGNRPTTAQVGGIVPLLSSRCRSEGHRRASVEWWSTLSFIFNLNFIFSCRRPSIARDGDETWSYRWSSIVLVNLYTPFYRLGLHILHGYIVY